MDTEFPGNSRRALTNRVERDEPETEADTPKLEPVVTGKVVRRKKPLGRRFINTFFAGDGVLGYLGKEVLLPALQNLITDFVTQGVEKAVYGEVRTARGSSTRGSSAPRTTISYDRYSTRPAGRDTPPARSRGEHKPASEAADVVVDTRAEAEEIVEKMCETIEDYGAVTVANLNELLRQTSAYTDSRWGWTDLETISIKRIREGYVVQLPAPEHLR